MKNDKKITTTILAAAATLLALPLGAQVSFNGSYSQDFNTLPLYEGGSTASFTWVDDSTIPGWYSTLGKGDEFTSTMAKSSGGAAYTTAGQLYNWGTTADRALGLLPGTGDPSFATAAFFGVQLFNNTGSAINTLDISYVAEQWRRNVNATTLTMEYLVTSSAADLLTSEDFIAVGATSVTTGTGNAGGLNGNWHGNQTPVSVTLEGLNWQAGEHLWFRWGNTDGANSAGLAVDNFNVVTPIPEAGMYSWILVALGAGFLALRRRKR